MMRIDIVMALILGLLCVILYAFAQLLTKKDELGEGNWFPTTHNQAKREFELYAIGYTMVWIGVFAVVIITQAYEHFTATSYMMLGTSLAAPFLLQPLLYPLPAESKLPLMMRYSFKANLWIAIFSFIGNYWYTHYFYSVLGASYTFPAHRLNDVPIALYFCTHFYFVTYHTFSNMILRKIETRYVSGMMRTIFFWMVIFAFSYFTAFMETLTISSFPYYSFRDRFMAYTLGSAFYSLYFIVSFPVFYRIDEHHISSKPTSSSSPSTSHVITIIEPTSIYDVLMGAMGSGMIVLLLLDACRLCLDIPLHIAGKLYYLYQPAAAS